MGIERIVKNKFIRELYADPEWRDLIDSIFEEIDFPTIFRYLTIQGIPIYLNFDLEAIEREYITEIDPSTYRINLDFIGINLSVNPPFTLSCPGQAGQTVLYIDNSGDGLRLHLNGGNLEDATVVVESPSTGINLDLNAILTEGSFAQRNLPLLNNGVTSIYWLRKLAFARGAETKIIQTFEDDSFGEDIVEFEEFIDIEQLDGITLVKNNVILNENDLVMSPQLGGYKEERLLTITTIPTVQGKVILTLNGEEFLVYIPILYTIQEVQDVFLNTLLPGWTATAVGTTQVLYTSDEVGFFILPFSVKDIEESKELLLLTINKAPTFSGTVVLVLAGVTYNLTINEGNKNSVAAYIADQTFTGWTTSVENNVVRFLKNTSGVNTAPTVTDYGTNAYFVAQIMSALPYASTVLVTLDGIDHYIQMPLASPHTVAQDRINFVAAFTTYNSTTPTGWTCSIVSSELKFVKTKTGPTSASFFDDAGPHERVQIGLGPIVDKPSTFSIGLDGEEFIYDVLSTDTNATVGSRIINDPKILANWNPIMFTGTNILLQFTHKFLKTCEPPTVPVNSALNYAVKLALNWNPVNIPFSIDLKWRFSGPDGYLFNFKISVYGTKTKDDILTLMIAKMNANTLFAALWTAYKKGSATALLYGNPDILIQRDGPGTVWATLPSSYLFLAYSHSVSFGSKPNGFLYELISQGLYIPQSETFSDITLTRREGAVPVDGWAEIQENQDGEYGVNPSLERRVKGAVGINPSISLEQDGTPGVRYAYEVLGYNAGMLVLGDGVEEDLDGDYTGFDPEDEVPTEGKYNVIKKKYPTTQDKKLLLKSEVEVLVGSDNDLTDLIKSLYPARVTVTVTGE